MLHCGAIMEQSNLTWITNYIRGIADDVPRALYMRGKYRDVILPMTVLRRHDAILEDSRQYDGTRSPGDMLPLAEDTLRELADGHGREIQSHLYSREINAETCAICKADLLLHGEGEVNDNKPQPMRILAEIRTDVLTLEKETEGLPADILKPTGLPTAAVSEGDK